MTGPRATCRVPSHARRLRGPVALVSMSQPESTAAFSTVCAGAFSAQPDLFPPSQPDRPVMPEEEIEA